MNTLFLHHLSEPDQRAIEALKDGGHQGMFIPEAGACLQRAGVELKDLTTSIDTLLQIAGLRRPNSVSETCWGQKRRERQTAEALRRSVERKSA